MPTPEQQFRLFLKGIVDRLHSKDLNVRVEALEQAMRCLCIIGGRDPDEILDMAFPIRSQMIH